MPYCCPQIRIHRRKIGLLVSLILLSSSWVQPSIADNKQDLAKKQRQLEQVRSEINSIGDSLKSKQRSQSELEQQLKGLELELNKQAKSVRKLKRQTSAVRGELKKLHKSRFELEQLLDTHQQALATQLRAAYFRGTQENIKLLLNQQNPATLARMVKYYEYLNHARLSSIKDTETTLKQLVKTEESIASKQSRLSRLLSSSQSKHDELTANREKRRELLKQLREEIADNRLSISTLKRDEAHIQELIASLKGLFSDIPPEINHSSPFSERKGQLKWPIQGPLLNAFGSNRTGSDLSWQGIRIKAAAGSEVRAISHGRVAFADWLPGFGLILIIDHQDGFISLYGYNEALYKETGDWVAANEVVASVGQGSNEQASSLYFEIRRNGKPIDPKLWCRSQHG